MPTYRYVLFNNKENVVYFLSPNYSSYYESFYSNAVPIAKFYWKTRELTTSFYKTKKTKKRG